MFAMTIELQLLLAISTGIALLLVLIIKIKLNAFLSLLIASIWVGLLSGINPIEIAAIITKGMGDTLGFVATIVGLGTIFGSILEHSGGAQQLSHFLIKKTGEKRSRIAILFSGFAVAIPIFFDVAFIILFPVIQALSKRLNKPIMYFALPLLTGIALTHSFIPPTPGPVAVADILKVELGWMILLGIPVTLPAAIICGLWISKILIPVGQEQKHTEIHDETTLTPYKSNLVFLTNIAILLPLVLMILSALLSSLKSESLIPSTFGLDILIFIGHPFIALILATVFALYFLGKKSGLSRNQLFEISNKSLAPAGAIILITGAGGVLKQMLISTGIGNMIAENMSEASISILLLAYVITAIVRILQGSATIAMITAAGIVAPILDVLPIMSMPEKTLIALAIAAGSIIASHVNDSGFWLVNRLLDQPVETTLKSWTILSTTISIISFLTIGLLSILWF